MIFSFQDSHAYFLVESQSCLKLMSIYYHGSIPSTIEKPKKRKQIEMGLWQVISNLDPDCAYLTHLPDLEDGNRSALTQWEYYEVHEQPQDIHSYVPPHLTDISSNTATYRN